MNLKNSFEMHAKKIGIIGCGWLGSKILDSLSDKYSFYVTTTKLEKQKELNKKKCISFLIDFSDKCISYHKDENNKRTKEIFNNLDIIIVSLPFSKKEKLLEIKNRFHKLINFLEGYEQKIILFSSIGIYPDVDLVITENTISEENLNPNIAYVEKKMQQSFPRLTILRLGGLMGDDRVFSKYFKDSSSIPDATKPVNHVHYLDICNIVEILIKTDIEKSIYNVVAPMHPGKIKVFLHQKKEDHSQSHLIHKEDMYKNQGKIVSSEKLISEINYSFLFPNPVFFNTPPLNKRAQIKKSQDLFFFICFFSDIP